MRPAMLLGLALLALATLAEAGRDYYEVLGIDKKANDKEIKKVCALSLPLCRFVSVSPTVALAAPREESGSPGADTRCAMCRTLGVPEARREDAPR
jgi:hypothetical protein